MELCTSKFLKWRIQLYRTLCQSHVSAGDWESAGRVATKARDSVVSLRSEEAMDPPIPTKVENLLRTAHDEVRQMEFRIEVWRKLRDSEIRGEVSLFYSFLLLLVKKLSFFFFVLSKKIKKSDACPSSSFRLLS